MRQIRAQLMTLRVVVVGAGLRAHQERARVADARVGPQRLHRAQDLSIREAKVEEARYVVDQQKDFAFGGVVPDEAVELVQNLRREAGETIAVSGCRHGKEAERMQVVGEGTLDEAFQKFQATEGVEGVFGGVRL